MLGTGPIAAMVFALEAALAKTKKVFLLALASTLAAAEVVESAISWLPPTRRSVGLNETVNMRLDLSQRGSGEHKHL